MIYNLSFPKQIIQGDIAISGSKSISNRLLILQQVVNEEFAIENISNSEDTQLMKACFASFPEKKVFNVQNAGTVARFLTAFLATQAGNWQLNCAEPMKQRPIKILVDALTSLGAEINYLEKDGFLPISIVGNPLKGKTIEIPATVSSQYITALLLIAPILTNGLTIKLVGEIASFPYLEITEQVMKQCGISVTYFNQQFVVEPLARATPPEQVIFNESDWSSAAFYYTIAAILPNTTIQLNSYLSPDVSVQGDAQVANLFLKLGVETTSKNQTISLSSTNTYVGKFSENFYDKPDMVPAVAVACAALGIEAEFSGVENLVIKESNRLQALQNELQKVDVQFQQETKGTWKLSGKINAEKVPTTVFKTYHDHRIAMCFACLGFVFNGVKINHPEVVAKSYPDFWNDMKKLGLEVEQYS